MPQFPATTPALEVWLPTAVERLQQALQPQAIWLFGSHARGTATRRSDLDLLLVWETSLPILERIGQVLELLADAPCAVEPLCYTPDELERIRDRPFIRSILADRQVLHER